MSRSQPPSSHEAWDTISVNSTCHSVELCSGEDFGQNRSHVISTHTFAVHYCKVFHHDQGDKAEEIVKNIDNESVHKIGADIDAEDTEENMLTKKSQCNINETNDRSISLDKIEKNGQCSSETDVVVKMREAASSTLNGGDQADQVEAPASCTPLNHASTCQKRQLQCKNHVVDYRNLRRKGYFLEKSVWFDKIPDEHFETQLQSKRHVTEWLKTLPEGSELMRNSQEDLMGDSETYFVNHEELHRKYMSDEDELKQLLLMENSKKILNFSSVPKATLAQQHLISILTFTNKKVDDYLETLKLDPRHSEHEYVCGIVALPEKRIYESSQKNHNSYPNNSLISWIKHVILTIVTDKDAQDKFTNKDVEEGRIPETCGVVLRPYHGPVLVNGAIIGAGTTNIGQKKQGIVGNTLVHEVKTVLQAIHKALRRHDTTQPSCPPTSSLSEYETKFVEDPEIQRLTEMLRSVRSKKSTLRSVFGFRKTANIQMLSQSSRRRQYLIPQRSRFVRTLEGWIQRRVTRARERHLGQVLRDRITINSNTGFPQQMNNQNQHIRGEQRNIIASVLSSIGTFVRSLVPVTPEVVHIPHEEAHDIQSDNAPQQNFQNVQVREVRAGTVESRYRYKQKRSPVRKI